MGNSSSRFESSDHKEKNEKNDFLVYTVNISGNTSEKQIDGSSIPISFKTLQDASKAVCKIIVDNLTGTGFLAKFAVANGGLIYGIFTNNHVVSENSLADGKKFIIQFDAVPVGDSTNPSPFVVEISTTGKFRFTCPILDATFVRFEGQVIENLLSYGCKFLEVTTEWEGTKVEPVFVFQHPGGAAIHIAQGHFLQYYGLDVFHSVSTNYGSSGSPVALSNGLVIGIHKARSARSFSNYNVAVAIKAVMKAIIPYFCHPIVAQHLFRNPIILNQTYVAKLLKIGLQLCFLSPDSKFQGLMYVSPATIFNGHEVVTPIWYTPTSHGWFWTPTNPSDKTKETNWMPVSQLEVVGGYWHGQIPAPKNIRIINWLYQHNIICNDCPTVVIDA